MIAIWKGKVKLILILISIDVAISCLITNCPKGGKRSIGGFYPGNILDGPTIKKCKICAPSKEICPSGYCLSDIYCKDEGLCVAEEICCSENFCKFNKSCKKGFSSPKINYPPSTAMLAKILGFEPESLNIERK